MTTGNGRVRANIKEYRDFSWSSRFGQVSTLAELLAQAEANGRSVVTEVIFQAGTNMYYALKSQRGSDSLRAELKRTTSFLKERGLRCYWITPPRSRVDWISRQREEDFVKIIQEGLPDCMVFVTLPILDPRKLAEDDGIHYNPMESKQWAAEFLKSYLSAPSKSVEANIPKAPENSIVQAPKASRICDVEVRLVARPKVSTDLFGIVYTHALAEFVYEVTKDNGDKACPKKDEKVVVVHQVVKNKMFTDSMNIEADRIYKLSLVEFESGYPELSGIQRISDHELFSAVPYANYFEFID